MSHAGICVVNESEGSGSEVAVAPGLRYEHDAADEHPAEVCQRPCTYAMAAHTSQQAQEAPSAAASLSLEELMQQLSSS